MSVKKKEEEKEGKEKIRRERYKSNIGKYK